MYFLGIRKGGGGFVCPFELGLLGTFEANTISIYGLFPNSFSYGVFANIGSGAVPGRLPNHGFREGSGEGSEPRVPARFRDRFRGCWG